MTTNAPKLKGRYVRLKCSAGHYVGPNGETLPKPPPPFPIENAARAVVLHERICPSRLN